MEEVEAEGALAQGICTMASAILICKLQKFPEQHQVPGPWE